MSKFSDLIQKKHEMLKVTMKVDPAACKNGEITHFQEYVGFVLAEKEFEKTYEKLLKKYTLQNEGFFDTVKGAVKTMAKVVTPIINNPITRRLAKDITEPFTDPKYNPFVGHGAKPVDKTEAGQIISEIESEWLDINKIIIFDASKYGYGIHKKSFKDLAAKDPELNKWLNFIRKSVKEKYSYKDLTNTLLEKINITPNPRFQRNIPQRVPQIVPQKNTQQVPQLNSSKPQSKSPQKKKKISRISRYAPKIKKYINKKTNQQAKKPIQKPIIDYVSVIKGGINQTDLNSQLPIRNMQNVYLPMIEKKIKEENAKRKEMREDNLKINSQDVWKTLVQKVETLFKASKTYTSDEKITWTFMLAQPSKPIVLTYDPMNQPS